MRARGPISKLMALAGLAALLTIAGAAPASASRGQESIFQDDSLLVFQPPAQVARTLDRLSYLGVDRVRVTVFWNLVAPSPRSTRRPAAFDATNPASYGTGFAPYDTLVTLAARRGIGIDFNVWGAVPPWAAGRTPLAVFDGHYRPSPQEFGAFMTALGRRYSGSYAGYDGKALPRVNYWSVWNEPNGIHFLGPVWERRGGRWVEAGAAIYRSLVDAGWNALLATGHGPGSDTILVGETAPQAKPDPAAGRSMRPLRFLRALYCVGSSLRPLGGRAAADRGCPLRDKARAFRAAHPALFDATGFAHHPYQLLLNPARPSQPDSVAMADIPRLTGTLDRIFRAYGSSRRIPIYNTEFGYESRPPSAFGVPLRTQASYINQSEFMSYRNPRLVSYSQFLLIDSANAEQFQSGLVEGNGRVKPSFAAYRAAIWIPRTQSSSRRFRVWGLFRPGRRAGVRSASVQFARFGRPFATIARASAGGGRGYVDRTVKVPASGLIRLAWADPAGGTAYSRPIAVFGD